MEKILMNRWSDDSINYQYNNVTELKEEKNSKFVSDDCKNFVDEKYINKKKNVTVRKWRVKIV